MKMKKNKKESKKQITKDPEIKKPTNHYDLIEMEPFRFNEMFLKLINEKHREGWKFINFFPGNGGDISVLFEKTEKI